MDYGGGNVLRKYQWDLIHHPRMIIPWLQDDEGAKLVIENNTRAFARLIKTINCAYDNNKGEVKLYLPTSTMTASVSGLVSELYLAGNPCTEDAEVKATLYEMFGEVVDLSNDYIEDVFNLDDIRYDEINKTITLKGNKYKLLINGVKDASCAYNFAKTNLSGSLHIPRKPIEFASLDDLQYSSPCELQYLSIENRKELLTKIQSETNWYDGSLKDSRQKITINIIATTPKEKQGDLLSFLSSNTKLLKTLYDRVDDYRGEFVEEINKIYQNSKNVLTSSTVVAIGIRPGVTIEDAPWYRDFNFLWGKLNLNREHISAEYASNDQISVALKEYDGPSQGLPYFFAEGEELCKGKPFDIIQGIDQQNGKCVDIPLICFLYESETSDQEAMYDDALSAGKLGVDGALIALGLKNLQGASALLKAEITAQNVVRLILGFGDMATLGLGEVCENNTSEFCKAYKDYEFYINMGMLSANILNEFPQLYKNLKKGLDDPDLSKTQKEGLRKILGGADDDLTRLVTGKGYSNIDNWINGITDATKRTEIFNLVKSWGDDVFQKLNLNLSKYDGLGTEFIANPTLLNNFEKLNTVWWSKFGQRKLSYKGLLPEKYSKMVDDIEINFDGNKITLRDAYLGDLGGGPMGTIFDEEMERIITQGWINGSFENIGLSKEVADRLTSLKNSNYELVIKPKVSIDGKKPEPDLIFVKKIGNVYEKSNIIYIDNKYFHDVGFTVPQKKIVNSINSTSSFAEVTTVNPFLDVYDNVIFPDNEILKINKVEIFTVNNNFELVRNNIKP